MNSLVHIAAFIGCLWLTDLLLVDFSLSAVGLMIMAVTFWVGLLTLLAVFHDVKAFIDKRGLGQ